MALHQKSVVEKKNESILKEKSEVEGKAKKSMKDKDEAEKMVHHLKMVVQNLYR